MTGRPPGVAIGLGLAFAALALPTRADAACVGRPTDAAGVQGYSYGSAEVRTHATGQIKVHWATSGPHAPTLTSTRGDGVPDTVAYAADVGEEALTRYAAMGFRKVPADTGCPSNGGDERVDVYLVHFAAADGSTVAECNVTATGGCPSFALVEASFASHRGYADAREGFRTVVTHELFHAVQNAYRESDASFWAEGTAQWAMKTVHPELPDFERQLPGFFKDPTRSLDARPTGVTSSFLYGSAVWPLFLATTQGPDVIREIFDRLGAQPREDVLTATDAVLAEKHATSLAGVYPRFAAWNAATGTLAGAGGYPDAVSYPGVPVSALADGTANITSGLGSFSYRGTLDAAYQVALETDETRNGGVVVPFENGKPAVDKAQALPANAGPGDVLVVVAGITTKKTDAPFTIRLLPPATGAPAAPPGGRIEDGCAAGDATGRGGHRSLVATFGVLLALVLARRSRGRSRG